MKKKIGFKTLFIELDWKQKILIGKMTLLNKND